MTPEIRLECLRLAADTFRHRVDGTTDEIVNAAKSFEDYVAGTSDPSPEKMKAAA